MKNSIKLALLCVLVLIVAAFSVNDISYFNQGFLRQGNAALDRAYLGITNSSGGSGTVTSVGITGLSPLFNAAVANPTTTPSISFSQVSQNQNLVYASPNGSSGVPTFRALVSADLPGGGSGTVTTFSAGNFSPVFTTSVANPTTTPALSFAAIIQNQNLFFASPNGSSGNPTFRAIASADLPAGVGTVTTFSSGNLNPLFTTSVANPTTTPSQTFAQVSQSQNLVFASPDGSSGNPTFRSISTNDLPYPPVAAVTNASLLSALPGGISLITTSNAEIPSFKTITAGSGITLTDNQTNVVIAATGGGGSTVADLLIIQTNHYVNWENVQPDIVDGANAGFTGIAANNFGFGSSGGTGAALTQHLIVGVSQGTWAEMRTSTTGNSLEFAGTTTASLIMPFTNGNYEYQAFVVVRNISNVRVLAGFSAAAFVTVLGADTIVSTNIVEFRYSTSAGDTTWHGVVSDGTGGTVVDTGVTVTADTDYYLHFVKTSSGVVFSVNHGAGTTASTHFPNIFAKASDEMGVFQGVTTLTTTAHTNLLRYLGYSMDWATK